MTAELVPAAQPGDRVALLVDRVLASGISPETRRAYGHALENFLAFCGREGNPPLSADVVLRYRLSLEGKSGSTIAIHLAAIKSLARAAMMAGYLPPETAASINDVRGPARRGNRIGNWLTEPQAIALLRQPSDKTLKGKRDHAILAVLLGCGLRRAELVAEVTVEALVERENRWVLADIVGKGNRVRSVAIPGWVKQAIDHWTTAAGITEGKVFRAITKGNRNGGQGKVWGEGLSPGAVLQIVQHYARQLGIENLAPHDLRRTCAKMCRKLGGEIEQIRFLLGHAGITTTEKYLGTEQDLVSAVNDRIAWKR